MVHTPEELKDVEGQEETHDPADASWLLVHVRQNFELPAHVEHDESHAVHVKLSVGERNVPVGQLDMHFPPESTKPDRQPVHCAWSIVEATVKFGIWQVVHLGPQAVKTINDCALEEERRYALSHSFLLLLAIKFEPEHIPLLSVDTQVPLKDNLPVAQTTHSLLVAPVQV